jgi:hypothetical protein
MPVLIDVEAGAALDRGHLGILLRQSLTLINKPSHLTPSIWMAVVLVNVSVLGIVDSGDERLADCRSVVLARKSYFDKAALWAFEPSADGSSNNG